MAVWVLVSFLVLGGDVKYFVRVMPDQGTCHAQLAALAEQVPEAQSWCVKLKRSDV